MNKQLTNNAPKSIIGKITKAIKDGWRSYSRAVDMAYNRGSLPQEKMNMELCTGNGHTLSSKPARKPFKAAAFDEYSSF